MSYVTGEALRISIGADDRAQVVALSGDVDFGTGAAVLDCVTDLAQRGADVVIDLSAAEFMDSAGLAALLGARRAAARSGRAFTLRHPPRFIARVLAVSGIDRLVDVEW
ncbi:MAG TPA: STAS domain-containing protein [Acidimicrobiales bacterium]|nr:STAS domain-containing protein [Acidimicrobiales bacterium]